MSKDKRRQYGTGSVYKRSSDGRWIGKISAGWTTTGTRRFVTVSASTEAECKRRLIAKQRQIAEHGIPEAGTARKTVKAYADEWLPRHARQVRPNAYAAAASNVHRWIVPTIGHKRLDELTPGHVRAVHDAIRAGGRKADTARHTHRTMMTMFKAAMLDGHQIPPRVILTKAPAKAIHDREAIPLAHAHAILGVARTHPDAARWVASLLNGMRQAERLGLTWPMVDLERGIIDVSWQLQALPYVDPKDKSLGFRIPDDYEVRHLVNAYHLARPKTSAGQRILPLMPFLSAALYEWRQVAPDNPWGLVWTGRDARNGRDKVTPLRDKVDRADWEALQDEAGVRHESGRYYTLHEARHTVATLLMENGVDEHVRIAIMGHSSITTTRGYQHVSQEMARQALEAVAARLQLTAAPATPPTVG